MAACTIFYNLLIITNQQVVINRSLLSSLIVDRLSSNLLGCYDREMKHQRLYDPHFTCTDLTRSLVKQSLEYRQYIVYQLDI